MITQLVTSVNVVGTRGSAGNSKVGVEDVGDVAARRAVQLHLGLLSHLRAHQSDDSVSLALGVANAVVVALVEPVVRHELVLGVLERAERIAEHVLRAHGAAVVHAHVVNQPEESLANAQRLRVRSARHVGLGRDLTVTLTLSLTGRTLVSMYICLCLSRYIRSVHNMISYVEWYSTLTVTVTVL